MTVGLSYVARADHYGASVQRSEYLEGRRTLTSDDSHGRLEGKVCLITGAGSGIGRATALLFAGHGALVAAADIDASSAAETASLADEAAGRTAALAVALDVTQAESCAAAVASVVDSWGRIDVLFNNAGIAGVGTVEETSLELWERVMAVNVRGVFLVAKAVLPVMVAAGNGSIINMSSTIAEIGLARRASYAASKGAVLALTRQMQADYAQHGIRVNALLPGTIHTPFVDRYLAESYDDPATGLEELKRRQLTGDLGRPEDVAAAALFLASDESRFVLGSGLFVDGGVRGAK
jgi:NAD(P)-dependent dehydrogenase (short-subunit alcohol dehydrogenase family)